MAQRFQMFRVPPPPPPPPPQTPPPPPQTPPQNGAQAAQQQYENFIRLDNIYYRCWQWFLVVPSFYFCFIESLLITFSEPPPLLLIGFASSPFLIDIGVSLFAYWDKIAVATVNDRKRIVANAVITVILHGVLIVPFEVFRTHNVFWRIFWRMLALVLRFFYSTRIYRLFYELEKNKNISNISFTVVGITKMMWVCFLVCHYGGCVFYIMATFHAHVEDTWFSLVDPNFVTLGLIKRYVTSMYYAVVSFTTVGYGDLHPVYIDEKIFSMVFLLVNFGLVVYVGTTIVYLVVPDAGPLGKYRARRVRVLDFCRLNGLSAELRKEVLSHLETEYQLQSQPSEENGILESLPTTVKRKILTNLSDGVKDTILFRHLPNPIQFQLIDAMEHVLFQANTSVILQNEIPTFLYFVVKGSVALKFSEHTAPTVVGPRNIFGETCVLFNSPQILTATTREFTQLLMLDRVKLLSILEGCVNDTSRMISDYIQDVNANNNQYMKQVLLDFDKRAKTVGRIDLPLSLWFAVRRSYSRLFDLLIERYPDPNECDETGKTAMHLAASSGDVEKVTKLLGIRADPNIKDLVGIVPLWNALFNGHANVVQVLKRNGCTLDGCRLGQYAYFVASQGRMDLLQVIAQENGQFLSAPNVYGQTALHAAVVLGDFHMIQYLVDMGVQIIQNDFHGQSPLSLAQIHGNEEIQNYLVERASLHEAIIQDNFPMVRYLLERGVPIDQHYVDLAHLHGHEEIGNYLEEIAMLFNQLF